MGLSDTQGGVPCMVRKLDFLLAAGITGIINFPFQVVWFLCELCAVSDIYTAVAECKLLALRQSAATFIVRFLREYFTMFLMLVRAFALIYGH